MDTQDANIHIHKVNPKEVRVEVVANASGVRNAQDKWWGGQYCSASASGGRMKITCQLPSFVQK